MNGEGEQDNVPARKETRGHLCTEELAMEKGVM